MKIDLSKVFDRVEWGFLRTILYKIGLARESVNWIMGCVSDSFMAVIINEKASNFFKPGQGLRRMFSFTFTFYSGYGFFELKD